MAESGLNLIARLGAGTARSFMKKEVTPQGKQKCSCCGRSQARVRWQGFRLCLACRVDITRDETLKDTMLGVGDGPSGKGAARIRYLSCPSCQRRVTKQYAFYCTQCRTRICIYCTAPDGENLCMTCSDKLLRTSPVVAAAGGSGGLMLYRSSDAKTKRRSLAGKGD